MKSRHVVLVSTLAFMGGAGVWVGCGGDDTTTPGVDAGTDTSTNPDTGGQKDSGGGNDGSTTDGSTTDGGGGGDGAVAIPQNCTTYCTLMMSACTQGNGQYIDQGTCEAMCAKFPGADAGAGDGGVTSGQTFACHAYHASVAAQSANNATVHCPHAGPYGFGGCGSETEDFCLMYNAFCAGGGGYGGNCANSFGQINDTTDGGTFLTGSGGAGPRDCREYHLENAYKSGGNGGGHCDHASKTGGGICN